VTSQSVSILTFVCRCVCCSRKQQGCQDAPIITPHALGEQPCRKPQRHEYAHHRIHDCQGRENYACVWLVWKITQLGLNLRSAKRIRHRAVGEDTCCRAVREFLALTLAFSVEEAAPGSRYGLKKACELSMSVELSSMGRSTYAARRDICYFQSPFACLSSRCKSERDAYEKY